MRKFVGESANESIKVGPVTSIETFKSDVENLRDWKDPNNQASYVKIILQFVGMYFGYKTVSTLENGKTEVLNEKYPKEYIKMLYDIAREKLPAPQELVDERCKLRFLFATDKENEMFYRYLAVFVFGFDGIAYLAEKSNFLSDAKESGLIYDSYNINMDTLNSITEQVSPNSIKM